MDFSKSKSELKPEAETPGEREKEVEPVLVDPSVQLDGQALIQTLVSLTGLPEHCVPLVNRQVDEILTQAGQDSSCCTIDDLRAAMLAYLESIHKDFEEMAEAEQISTQ